MNELTNIPVKLPQLSPQRKRFADAFLAGMNQTEASIEAGYSTKTATVKASSLLTIVDIKAYISYHQSETAKRNEIKLDEIVLGIREVISKCKVSKPYQSAQLLKAYELLAKMGGFMRDQGIDPDSRPAFVGISINMGEGTVKMVSTGGNSGGNSINNNKDKSESIDVTSAIK